MLQTANNEFGLDLEVLDGVDAPLTDMEWGILAGIAAYAGYVAGVALAT